MSDMGVVFVMDSPEFVIAEEGQGKSRFNVVYNGSSDDVNERMYASAVCEEVKNRLGVELSLSSDIVDDEADYEIIIGSLRRSETSYSMEKGLKHTEFSIKVFYHPESGKTKLAVAYNGKLARYTAISTLLKYIKNGRFAIPYELDILSSCSDDMIISSDVTGALRDPFVLYENGIYYVYGTGWHCYKNSERTLSGHWERIEDFIVEEPSDYLDCPWAPEVYKYNDSFYMFTTYRSDKTMRRGCAVFRSASPEGPFKLISDGHVTPEDWDAIDGSLYIDPQGQPWMVFSHEWTSPDGLKGFFAAAKLSSDLTRFISEPVELFYPGGIWSGADITDGCFMYTTRSGELLMLWSNFDIGGGYGVGVARSVSGGIEGPWIHDPLMLYSSTFLDRPDGGHGMIFTDTDGSMYMPVHTPNTDDATPIFIRVYEENDALFPAVPIAKNPSLSGLS